MLILGILVSAFITLLPGILVVRLLRRESLRSLDALLYAIGFGLLFNLAVGLVANFTFGVRLLPIVLIYLGLLCVLGLLSWKFGVRLPLKWTGWKPLAIPLGIYLLAVVLQLQTTLMSPNLVGSDIHLEYFMSNMVLEDGFWNPMYMGTYVNTCLGLTVLLPVYKLLSCLELLWIYKLICPLIFAVLPLALYRIFRMQFSTTISLLAVVFFVTMPIFTMDMVQLVRQQQSELFFILICLVVMDENVDVWRKVLVGVVFTVGVMVTHVGIAIGFVGYMLGGFIFVVLLSRLWRNKVDDAKKKMFARWILAVLFVGSIGVYAVFFGFVYSGKMITSVSLPIEIAKKTVSSFMVGIDGSDNGTLAINPPSTFDKPPGLDTKEDESELKEPSTQGVPSLFRRFPFLNPLLKEPLAQTAIGLDFGKASALGKVWRILQYLVEICIIIGFLKLLLKPPRNLRIEYMAFVISSLFVLAGIYLLSTYGWGLGAVRVWGITLLFMSPLFVIGCATVGGWLTMLKAVNVDRMVLFSALALLIPYFVFNSGLVFEVAKMKPVGFVDVPYSVVLSGHRVDLASVFEEQDVEAMDWLKVQFLKDKQPIYADTHGGNLMVQRIGTDVEGGQFKYFWQMADDSVGYVFLRKWNVDNGMITKPCDYGTRESYSIDDFEIVGKKIADGTVLFDNGAMVILVGK